jgi:hypothetical protein
VGEFLGLAVVIVALGLAGAAMAYVAGGERRRALAERTPIAIDPGDREATLNAAREYFKIAQLSARTLESLLADDLVNAVVPAQKQAEIRALIERFYEL